MVWLDSERSEDTTCCDKKQLHYHIRKQNAAKKGNNDEIRESKLLRTKRGKCYEVETTRLPMERKTKTKNKINKKKELPENKHGKKRKRASAHSIGVTKMKLLKKKKS